MSSRDVLIKKVESFQNLLISYATGGKVDPSDYLQFRRDLISAPELKDKLPRFVHTCRDLYQFWTYIKQKFPTYAERRAYLWSEFNPIISDLESESPVPSDVGITELLSKVDSAAVQDAWARALDRRLSDPAGAITAARTLLESVCKYILDSTGTSYDDTTDLPKLYKVTSETLNLAPSQHSELILRQILGGITAAVEGLGAMRNKLGDAHGRGKNSSKSELRHSELAVNLAGTIATFLIATHEAQTESA